MIQVAVFDSKPYDRRYLEQASAGQPIQWRFHDFRLSNETVATARGATALCAFVNDQIDKATLEALHGLGLGLLALRCAGFNNVDLPAAKTLGIKVVRVPAYSPHAVAEHAVALLLTLNRKTHRAYNRVREHNFSLNGLIGFDLAGKTAGIVGTGRIGRIAARIFRGFDCRVLAYDPAPAIAWAEEQGVSYLPLERMLPEVDILSLHVPLLPATFHLLNAEALARLKPGVFIINTSRGKLIDTRALIEALKNGCLGGVALDVYEEEEGIFFEDHSGDVLLDDDLARLLSFPNVLVTSHQAFLTDEALAEIARVTITNLTRWSRAEPFLEGTEL